MITTLFQPLRRMSYSAALMLLVIFSLAIVLSACGGDATTTTAPASGGASSGGAATGGSTSTITITEKTGSQDIYAFDPLTLSIKAGDSVKFVNNSDENHKLAVSPAGPTVGTVTRSGSNDNTETIAFPTAGTFTITSTLVQRAAKDAANEGADSKATVTITVQ
jgi:plastocyanin